MINYHLGKYENDFVVSKSVLIIIIRILMEVYKTRNYTNEHTKYLIYITHKTFDIDIEYHGY